MIAQNLNEIDNTLDVKALNENNCDDYYVATEEWSNSWQIAWTK